MDIHCMAFSLPYFLSLKEEGRTGGCSGKSLDLYSGGAGLESWPENRQFLTEDFHGLPHSLQPSKSLILRRLGHNRFHRNDRSSYRRPLTQCAN
jgi:hypothetical protein